MKANQTQKCGFRISWLLDAVLSSTSRCRQTAIWQNIWNLVLVTLSQFFMLCLVFCGNTEAFHFQRAMMPIISLLMNYSEVNRDGLWTCNVLGSYLSLIYGWLSEEWLFILPDQSKLELTGLILTLLIFASLTSKSAPCGQALDQSCLNWTVLSAYGSKPGTWWILKILK